MAIWLSLCGASLVLAYLLGSIPTGYIVVKQLKGIDIRQVGSGSTGATNVLRTLGKSAGTFVLAIDCLKGVLAIFLVYWLFQFAGTENLIPTTVNTEIWQPWIVTLAGLAAIFGHSKSIFLGFTGGKSVATSLGILLAMNWQVSLAVAGVFGVVLGISRLVSLSSIAAAIAVFIFMLILHQSLPYVLFGIAAGLYVILRHRSNILRLFAGTEPKLGQSLTVQASED